MSVVSDTNNVKKNISEAYIRKQIALYSISLYYASEALSEFRSRQSTGEFWDNQTNQAMDRVFSDAFIIQGGVGFRLSHGVGYGVYLELANNRRHEALRPIIEKMKTRYMWACGELYKDRQ